MLVFTVVFSKIEGEKIMFLKNFEFLNLVISLKQEWVVVRSNFSLFVQGKA